MREIEFLTYSLIAHRGYHNIKNGIPENSMLAFKEAIKNDLIIELDVRILKDGKVVVFHDESLKRMTGIDKKIEEINSSELEEIHLLETNQRIPLLEEVLDLINGQVSVIIELKSENKDRKLEKETIRILKNYRGKYAIKSFNPFSIRYFKKNFPSAIRGQLASNLKNKKMNIIKKVFLSRMLFNIFTKPDFISYNFKDLPNNRIKKLRKKMIILGWTVRNEEDLEYAKKYCDNCICENINLDK